jgi:hypothetical protein
MNDFLNGSGSFLILPVPGLLLLCKDQGAQRKLSPHPRKPHNVGTIPGKKNAGHCLRAALERYERIEEMKNDYPIEVLCEAFCVSIDWAGQKHSIFVRFTDGDSYLDPKLSSSGFGSCNRSALKERSPLLLNNAVDPCIEHSSHGVQNSFRRHLCGLWQRQTQTLP